MVLTIEWPIESTIVELDSHHEMIMPRIHELQSAIYDAKDGCLVYHGYGMLLANTFPLTLTPTPAGAALVGHSDAATGLVHLGDGR